MPCVARRRLWVLTGLALFPQLTGVPALAQPVGRGGVIAIGEAGEPEGRTRVHPPTDRLLSRGMREAQQSIGRGEFVQALVFLDNLLGRPEDFFTDTGAEGEYAGLKETARRLIRELPSEGRRAYETAYAPVAERLLRESLASGDEAKLHQVVQRYFYTPAGYQAALLLAADESDAARHLAAALIYQQLLETPAAVQLLDPELSVRAAASWLAAEEPDRARSVLESLAARGRTDVEVAGRSYTLGRDADPLAWLSRVVGDPTRATAAPERQWLTYRGNPARNGEAAGGLPHMRVRWKVRLLSPYPKLEQLYEEYESNNSQSGAAAPVAGAPLAAGDYVIVRSPLGLLGVDFRTGKRVWHGERQLDRQIVQLVKSGGSAIDDQANAEPARAFAARIWDDYLFGVTSSDGDRVYAIRDLPLPSPRDFEFSPMMGMPGVEAGATSNRLSAYELAREGTLVWEIDGASVPGDLNGAYFLGAPLAVGSSLYVLVEIRDDIYLASLDRATGALEWRQQLANLETGVLHDLRRRLQASMPSYDSGMLVCPTGAGLVVGVDLAKRSLAWAYQYKSTPGFDGVFSGGIADASRPRTRWMDGAALIADGRVLVTPPESDELHCLDLRTGKLLWKQPRGEMNRLACVSDDVLLLVGKQKLTALRLEDGKPAWADRSLELPRGAEPAGNGFLTGGRYIFPLASAEVVAVDVATGQITARVGARDGAPLGNLICHRGAIISQNGLSLDCFDQVDDLLKRSERQLADNPDSVDALRALGEIAYNEGRLSEAIDLEERAYRQAPDDPDVREILAECLADALDGDFAAYRSRLPLLKELESDGAVTRSHVLRLESQGLLAAGDPMGSLRACLAMARAADDAGELLRLRRDHRTHTARWVQAQVAAIWDAADEDQRTVLIDRAQKEAAALGDNPSGEDIEHFLRFFGALPAFDDLKLVRARQLDTEGRTLESQQLLLDLTHSSDEAIQREAVARIAAQLHAAGLHGLAGEYDDQLAGALADAPCLDGVTGRDLTARWAESTADANLSWPTGQVEVRGAPATAAGVRSRGPVWSMRLEHADSILGSGVGFLAMRGSELTWHDGLGRRVFAAAFDDQSQTMYRQPGSVYASARGNLLVVSSGRELAAFNTLAKRDAEAPSLVWRASLASNFDVDTMFMGADSLAAERRPGSFRPRRTPYENKWLGVIGPITSSGCYFQDQRRLVCVNPITGEEQWSRSDVPPGCDLFGDSRYVFATPVGSQVAQVFNALDGRSLGEVRVPSWEEQVTTRGRKVIRWNRSPQGELTLSEVDPLAKGVNWQHTFAVGARIDIDRDRYVAVVEPMGRAAIVDLETGALLVDHAQLFTPQPRLDEIHLSAASDHFVLVVEQPAAPDTGRNLRALNSNDSPVVDGQLVVLNRTDGTSRWARPASVLRQALVLNQPAELPFVMFAGTLVSSTRGEGEGRNSTSLLLIDKATGRTLYSSDELPQIGVGYLTAELTDTDKREVTIDMAGRPLVVQFTNARRPPQPPAMAEVESATSKPSEGIYGIFRSLGGGG